MLRNTDLRCLIQNSCFGKQDKLLAAAWKRGGLEAEKEVRDEMVKAEHERIMSGVRHLIK